VILECEGSGSTGRGQSELIHYFLPQLIVGDCLSAALPADCAVEFEQVQLLSSDLRDLYLADTFGGPVLPQVLFEFVLLFELGQTH
jgi:hypothetical protein